MLVTNIFSIFSFSQIVFERLLNLNQGRSKSWLCDESWGKPYSKRRNAVNSFLPDDTRSFCGQCRSRSDCTEHAVWSFIYTVHIFILDYNWTLSSSCHGSVFLANEKLQFIYSLVKELSNIFSFSHYVFFPFVYSNNGLSLVWIVIC